MLANRTLDIVSFRRSRGVSRIAGIVGRALGLIALVTAGVAIAAYGVIARGGLVDPGRMARGGDTVTVLDRHGVALRHVRAGSADRRWIALADVPPDLVRAFLAAEDARFMDHHGADVRATMRALFWDLVPGARRSGASTITQQLVKLVYGRPHGVWDKPLEVLRAIALEREMPKGEILEQYLNRVPFGDGIEGIERASEAYFGHPVATVTLAEAALLAGVPRAPSANEPRRHRAQAMTRRNVVLARMHAEAMITDDAWAAALHEIPAIADVPARPYEAPRFVDRALRAWHDGAIARIGSDLVTSLDGELQRRVEAILTEAVDRFDARGAHNGAAVVIRNATGEILAYVASARHGAYSRGGDVDLLSARRQPGSTLKPFVYGLLFERGATAATVLDDMASSGMTGAHGEWFEARDYDGHERGPVRARVALASSLNLAALDAARQVGAETIVARLAALGIHGLDGAARYGAAVVLGGADVSPLDLAGAYVTLARGGTRIPLSMVPTEPQRGVSVMPASAARLVWDILGDPHARADAFGRDLLDVSGGVRFALKTGTSAGYRDAWAVTATERVTVLVWLGDPGGGPMASVSGFEAAAPAAARIVAIADVLPDAQRRISETSRAEPMVEIAVCAWSGLRVGARCRHVVRERFVHGTAARMICDQHDAGGNVVVGPRYAGWVARARPASVIVGGGGSRSPAVRSAMDEPRDVRIVEPREGARWAIDGAGSAPTVALRAVARGLGSMGTYDAQWSVDDVPIEGDRWRLSPGTHRLVARVGALRSAPREVRVESAQ